MSVGVATTANEVCEADDLIERADRALYQAKHAGRNRVAGPLDPLPVVRDDCAPLHANGFDPASAQTQSTAAASY